MLTGLVATIGGCLAVIVSGLSQDTVNYAASVAARRQVSAFEPKLLMVGGAAMVLTGIWLIATRERPGERSAALGVLLASAASVAASLYIAALVYANHPQPETSDFTLILIFAITAAVGGLKRFRAAGREDHPASAEVSE